MSFLRSWILEACRGRGQISKGGLKRELLELRSSEGSELGKDSSTGVIFPAWGVAFSLLSISMSSVGSGHSSSLLGSKSGVGFTSFIVRGGIRDSGRPFHPRDY